MTDDLGPSLFLLAKGMMQRAKLPMAYTLKILKWNRISSHYICGPIIMLWTLNCQAKCIPPSHILRCWVRIGNVRTILYDYITRKKN